MDANCKSGMESHANTDSTLIRVPISRIRPFEKSPRRQPNSVRLRLKESIRQHGLDQAFVVTQPPSSKDYVLAAGGTTRLLALHELAAETDGPDFATVPCIVTPWPGDTALILAHLRENDLRSGLTFIEEACAVAACQRLLEAETGRALSQQEMAELLLRHGYGFSQAHIAQMRYAVTRLLEVMPTSLDSGLGCDDVRRIQRLDAVAAERWVVHGLDATQSYDETFLALCRRYDSADWCFDDLEEALAVEIAEGADLSIQSVRLALRASAAQDATASDAEARIDVDGASDSEVGAGRGPDSRRTIIRAYSRGFNRPVPGERSDHGVQEPAPTDYMKTVAQCAQSRRDNAPLKSARARCWTLALRLANRFGLQELVVSTPGVGVGFLLMDYPDNGFLSSLSQEKAGQVWHVWDHLAASCELLRVPSEDLTRTLTPGSALYRNLLSTDDGLAQSCGQIESYSPRRVPWAGLEEAAWRDYVALLDARLAVHANAELLGVSLWSTQ